MANSTASYATTIHGTNPQYLIEKIIRSRIYECKYWKEHCTLLTSALVLEKAVDDLKYIGGVYGGNVKPTPFLCLVLKLLQIQPQMEIIDLYIEQTNFKYLRALGAFYLRLVGSPVEVYSKLEPLLRDYRKLRLVDRGHKFSVIHMDEYIDNLIHESRVFDIVLPRLIKRYVLEENRDIEPYKSELEEQNLIPMQIIEEKVEQATKSDRRSVHYDHRSRRESDHSSRHRHTRNRDARSSYQSSRRDSSPSRKGKSKFKQEDIDTENAIRAKLGLRPLK